MPSNSPTPMPRRVRLDVRLSGPLDAERLLAMTRHRRHRVTRFELLGRRECHMWLECRDVVELSLLLARLERMPGVTLTGEVRELPSGRHRTDRFDRQARGRSVA